MSITRRRLDQLAAGLPFAQLAAGHARAQAFPSRTITCVVAYGPGTGTDLLARQITERMGTLLGQRIVVENRPGASGTLADAARRALEDPDLRRALSDSATRIEFGGPQDLASYTASEIERYKPIIDRAGGRAR